MGKVKEGGPVPRRPHKIEPTEGHKAKPTDHHKTKPIKIITDTPKTGMIRARVEPDLKIQAEKILADLGLNASDAIRLFYKQITLTDGLPFDVKIPNAETRKAMREAEAGKVNRYASADEMFKKMGI